jgi:hypothetical protein
MYYIFKIYKYLIIFIIITSIRKKVEIGKIFRSNILRFVEVILNL